MFERILRALSGTSSDRVSTKTRTSYRWRCSCGAQSRNGWNIPSDAEYATQRHQWSVGVGHPTPEVYSTGGSPGGLAGPRALSVSAWHCEPGQAMVKRDAQNGHSPSLAARIPDALRGFDARRAGRRCWLRATVIRQERSDR